MTLLVLLVQSQLGLEAASWRQRYYNHNDNNNNSSRWTTTTSPVTLAAAGVFVFRDCGELSCRAFGKMRDAGVATGKTRIQVRE